MSEATMPILLSSNIVLQQKREREIPNDIRDPIPKMKKCQKCSKKWYYTMLQKCIKCKYHFCPICQIKQFATNATCNWACPMCSYINEEQYKINLIQLEDEVKGILKSDNWYKCTACNIETVSKYNFYNSNNLYEFLNMKSLLTEDDLNYFNNDNKTIVFENQIHLCSTCVYYLITPPYGNIDMFMLFFNDMIIPQTEIKQNQIKMQRMSHPYHDSYEFSTHSHSKNNTSESKAVLSLNNKIFGISKEKIKKKLNFDELQNKMILNTPINRNTIAKNIIETIEENNNNEDNDTIRDYSKKQSSKTDTHAITSDICFTLYNQYPKNYHPITFDFLQQLQYLEEVLYFQIQSFYYFIELNQIFNQNLDNYSNSNTNSNSNYYHNNQTFNNLFLYQNSPNTASNNNNTDNNNNNNNNQAKYPTNKDNKLCLNSTFSGNRLNVEDKH